MKNVRIENMLQVSSYRLDQIGSFESESRHVDFPLGIVIVDIDAAYIDRR